MIRDGYTVYRVEGSIPSVLKIINVIFIKKNFPTDNCNYASIVFYYWTKLKKKKKLKPKTLIQY